MARKQCGDLPLSCVYDDESGGRAAFLSGGFVDAAGGQNKMNGKGERIVHDVFV